MCGILGVAGAPVDPARLSAAARCLTHRGPDDGGELLLPECSLAVRRLAVTDPDGGHQPIANEDSSVHAILNGEIFNDAALRAELETRGHRFATRSDTEVLVHAYEEWGDRFVTRLRGMFAFAVWDAPRTRLLLVRDRFGIKPLFLARAGSRLAFASEAAVLFTLLPELGRRASPTDLYRCIELGFVDPPGSVFEGVEQLPAAHLAVIENGTATLERYWTLTRPGAGRHDRLSPRDAADLFIATARDAVRSWSRSDVPLASLLSSGVDSSTIAALLCEHRDEPLHTFTLSFPSDPHNEAPLARETAARLGTAHTEVRFDDSVLDALPEIVRSIGEPRSSLSHVALWSLFRACHQAGFKVVMSGEGSDEMLGGYSWYHGEGWFAEAMRLPGPIRHGLAHLPGLPPAARRNLVTGACDVTERFAGWLGAAPAGLARLLTWQVPAASEQWRERFRSARLGLARMDQLALIEQHTRMPGFIIHGVDCASMAHSVEARTPFLDHQLWEIAVRIPPSSRMRRTTSKLPIRLGSRGLLPRSVRFRAKRGLGVDSTAWWRRDRLPDWAEDVLTPAQLRACGYFNVAEVERLRAAHRAGAAHMYELNAVLTTQLWHHEVLTRSPGL